MFTNLNEPIFYLAGHNWPLLDWGVALPEKLKQDWVDKRGGDPQARIAALPVMCNESHEFSYDPIMETVDLSRFDLVLLSDIEFHSIKEITAWIKKNGIKNYLLSVGGRHAGEELDPTNTVYRPWWMYNLLRFNTYQDLPIQEKPFMFEVLLGARRPHRDFALMGLEQIGQLDNSIATYRTGFLGGYEDHLTKVFAWYFGDLKLRHPYISPNLDLSWETQQNIQYNNVSPYVPWEIYRRTHYSVVCETLGAGDTFFLTEKSTKALWGKRIFVIFSVPNFLQGLRSLGFRTFGDMFDESYDQETDILERYKKAVQTMKYLSEQDPVELCRQALPILEHNHSRVTELQKETQQAMQTLLKSKLG